jgi:hypothetical protein
MKSDDQLKLEFQLLTDITNLRILLNDSPQSFMSHRSRIIGFYNGWCVGRDVDPDLDFISQLEAFRVDA